MKLNWTSRDTWGTIGRSHYAKAVIGGSEWSFTVDKAYKSHWTVRGWKGGLPIVYREPKTLAEAKAFVQEVVDSEERGI